jgi:hypothetical protein
MILNSRKLINLVIFILSAYNITAFAQDDWHFVDESATRLPETTTLSQALDIGDINNSNSLSILIGQQPDIVRNIPGVAQLFQNNGSGYFGLSDSSIFPQRNDYTSVVMLFDAEGDSDLDAFVANANYLSDYLAINNGSGIFTIDQGRLRRDSTNALTGDYADIEGDGDIDVSLLGNNEVRYSHALWINNGQGYFQNLVIERFPDLRSYYRYVGFADIDGDLDPDIAAVYDDGIISHPTIFINDGEGYFNDDSSSRLPPTENFSCTAALIDIDGDKDYDIVLAYATRLGFLVNDGTGHFTDETLVRGPVYPEGGAIAIGAMDTDNDGDADIIIGTGVTHPDLVFINDGTGHFVDETALRWPDQADGTYMLSLADLNNDGSGDIFRVGFPSSLSRIYINTLYMPDSIPPDMKNQSIFPSIDTSRGPYPVKLMAQDGIAIPTQITAFVYYSTNGTSYNAVPMHYTGAHIYYGIIPQVDSGTTVYYYYSATDKWQNTSFYPANSPDSVLFFTCLPEYVGIEEDEPHLPMDLTLSAYPNPFNSATTITLTGVEQAEIGIYDIMGRLITRLHTVGGQALWDASAYSSGLYSARLAGQKAGTIKLILLK